MASLTNGCDVIVVGAGVIGLATAWRAAQDGCRVALLDPKPGSGATQAAAGVLAPLTGGHDDGLSLDLAQASMGSYAGFVEELEALAGFTVDFRSSGTLAVAIDPAGEGVLLDLATRADHAGVPTQHVDAATARQIEPGLTTQLRAGLLLPEDGRVDPRKLVTALLHACRLSGVAVMPGRVRSIITASGKAVGVQLEGGDQVRGAAVVLAAGTATSRIGAPAGVVPGLRSVQGELVMLRGEPGLCTRTVRLVTAQRTTWVVPRSDNRYVVGATVHEDVADGRVHAAGVRTLLQDAASTLPRLDTMFVEETPVGQRSAVADGLPVIGWSALPGLLLATGHLRKGILEAPATADACVQMLRGEPTPYPALSPDRLVKAAV